jgi:hypothetical protein
VSDSANSSHFHALTRFVRSPGGSTPGQIVCSSCSDKGIPTFAMSKPLRVGLVLCWRGRGLSSAVGVAWLDWSDWDFSKRLSVTRKLESMGTCKDKDSIYLVMAI